MSTSASTSFYLEGDPSPPRTNDSDEIDSLPSTETGTTEDDVQEESEAEREWRESMQQLELLLTIFVVPYIGKYIGRKVAYWGMDHRHSNVSSRRFPVKLTVR